MTTFSVRDSPELQATILLYRRASPQVQKAVKASVKAWGSNVVTAARARARGDLQERIAVSARTQMTAGKGVRAVFGSSGTVLSGTGANKTRVPLRALARPAEFGANRAVWAIYSARTPRGRTARVRRHTQRQYRDYRRAGMFAWPAVADVTPDAARMLVQAMREAYTDG